MYSASCAFFTRGASSARPSRDTVFSQPDQTRDCGSFSSSSKALRGMPPRSPGSPRALERQQDDRVPLPEPDGLVGVSVEDDVEERSRIAVEDGGHDAIARFLHRRLAEQIVMADQRKPEQLRKPLICRALLPLSHQEK